MLIRHCIVTPQFPGLQRNGGIGTHCYYLSKFLQKPGVGLTLLYTHPEAENGDVHRKHPELKFDFVWEKNLPFIRSLDAPYFLQTSARCYAWLKEQSFDFIHFQDWRADGFRSVQAKRTGQAFGNTILTCMLNGSSLWSRQGMKQDPYVTREDILLDYCEAYTARHCDRLLSPSRYSLEWAAENWDLQHPRALVLPYLFDAPFRQEGGKRTIKKLIFFGRLETRKGLEIFFQALRMLDEKQAEGLEIIFVGSRAPMQAIDSVLQIENFFRENLPQWTYRIEHKLGHAESLEFLRETPDKLVVIPSLSETLCFTVLECLECHFNFIASRVGGIPELLGESNRLFEPTAPGLRDKLEEALAGKSFDGEALWSREATREKWEAFFRQSLEERALKEPAAAARTPLVSVCIPHFNGTNYLEETLQALQKQTYSHFEVCVRDDGSDDPVAGEEFRRLAGQFGKIGWSFTSHERNRGPGYTRNRMAELSSGEYLLFVDADNVPEPEMIARMVTGALRGDLDGTGCFMRTILTEKPEHSHEPRSSTWMPVGPVLPTVFFGNIIGETNTLFKATTFRQLGGFPEDPAFGNEDWELIIRLILSGFSFDIVPEFLFLYRIRRQSHVRATPSIQNRMRAWRPLFEDLPPAKRFLATSLFIWEWRVEAATRGPDWETARKVLRYESSWLYQVYCLFRQPRKTLRSWRNNRSKGGSLR